MCSINLELSTLIRSLALSNPSYFLIPDSWPKYEAILRACDDKSDAIWTSCIRQIETRNLRLVKKSGEALRESGMTSRQRLVALLDATRCGSSVIILAEKALDMLEDRALLICTVLEWATTQYRNGLSRIYVALRLLRHWDQAGLDLDTAILRFLGQVSVTAGLEIKAIYRMVAEMIRTRLFPISKYMQWIMARGSRSEHAEAIPVSAN